MSVAGAQSVLMNILRGMKDDPLFDIRLIVRDSPKGSDNDYAIQNEELPVIYCNYSESTTIVGVRTIVNWLKCQYLFFKEIMAFKPDIIHTHLTDLLPFTIIPELLSGARVFIHTLHSDPYAISKRFVKIARFAFNRLKFYPICVTESQAKKAIEVYGISSYSVVHNGIDKRKFDITENRDTIRQELKFNNSDFVIGYVGRLSAVKNLDYLIEVFSEYKKQNANAKLLIVGDGGEKARCISLVNNLGVTDSVIFAGQRNDVERMYKAMDLFMLTSFYESSSLVTVEAQCAGVPCLVADSVPENVIVSSCCKRLSLEDDLSKWLEAIDILSEVEPESNNEMVSIEEMIEELKSVYIKCLGLDVHEY